MKQRRITNDCCMSAIASENCGTNCPASNEVSPAKIVCQTEEILSAAEESLHSTSTTDSSTLPFKTIT